MFIWKFKYALVGSHYFVWPSTSLPSCSTQAGGKEPKLKMQEWIEQNWNASLCVQEGIPTNGSISSIWNPVAHSNQKTLKNGDQRWHWCKCLKMSKVFVCVCVCACVRATSERVPSEGIYVLPPFLHAGCQDLSWDAGILAVCLVRASLKAVLDSGDEYNNGSFCGKCQRTIQAGWPRGYVPSDVVWRRNHV